MKTLIIALSIACGLAVAQTSNPNLTLSSGFTPVAGRTCDQASLGSIYTYGQPPASGFSGVYVCQQIGSTSLGSGAYGWVPIQNAASSAGSGTVSVATGKAAVISNSLTFAGTDGTTMTFPSTSGTVVTLAGTQTLTNKTLTAPVIATISNTGTVTLPSSTGGVPVAYSCGATSGNAACANTSGGATARVLTGIATLSSNSAIISGIAPAFSSTTSFACVANDITTRANPVQVDNTSTSSITITNTTGAADVIHYVCVGY